jgi:hypothetical protein
MKTSTRALIAFVLLPLSALAAQPLASDSDSRLRLALANTGTTTPSFADDTRTLDSYAGRYETSDGAAFIVDAEGETLTIELPGASERPHRLLKRGALEFGMANVGASVTFAVGADGEVSALLYYAGAKVPPVAAFKRALHPVVTIHDLPSAEPSSVVAKAE